MEGLAGLCWRALRHAIRPVVRFDHVLFYETDLSEPLPPVKTGVPVEIRVVGAFELERFAAQLEECELHQEDVRHRLEAGDLPIIATSGRELTHIQWMTARAPQVTEIGAMLLLDPGRACAYDALTLPKWRGHGIHAAASRVVWENERDRGYTHHVSWVEASNVQSLRTNEKLGHRLTESVWAIRFIGMRRPLLLGDGANRRPRLRRLRTDPRRARTEARALATARTRSSDEVGRARIGACRSASTSAAPSPTSWPSTRAGACT